ncbi:MAG TPA: glycerol-3-phosphate acyltransferase [Solirubrobacteraceae bacterium]|nr:glycerol-3-phosphate acyltransferase [Solirubrobacteraceae bacterium]
MTAVAALVGYLLGAVSPATFLARRAGADLRASGSGNPGATNVGRLLGRRAGITVALLDVSKGLVPALVFSLLVSHRAGLVAGLAAVLGHVTSPYLRGHGGKGVATAGGAVLGSHPVWAPFVLAAWVVVVLATRWVALGSVCAAAVLPLLALVTGASGADVAWASGIALVVVARHRRNFVHRFRRRPPSTDPLP